jgi:NACalpha-BTF3-like transcription factor
MTFRIVSRFALLLCAALLLCIYPPHVYSTAYAGSGQSQQELVLTIHGVCKASADSDIEGQSMRDDLSVTFEERNVYRITEYDNSVVRADLELVSHQANVSAEGGGTWKAASGSWTHPES